MKIKLERRLIACPNKLRCTVCFQIFETRRIRTLLYNNKGLLQGDVCPNCLKLKANGIRQKIQEQSKLLMKQAESEGEGSLSVSSRQLAVELLECSKEDVKLPTFYQWLLKQMEIFAQESQELEAAKLGLSNCACGRRSQLRIFFKDDRELD